MPSPASRESAARRPVVPLKAGPVRNFSRLGPCARGQVRVSQQRKRTARGAWPSGQRTRGSNRPLLEPDPTGLPAGSALIVVERGPNAGSRLLLDQPVTSVGRHPRSDSFLGDVTVSRRHVELRWENDDFHDHVARPQCRQLCKCRDRRHKAPKKKPSPSQHRFWHHCGDGCAFGAGSQ